MKREGSKGPGDGVPVAPPRVWAERHGRASLGLAGIMRFIGPPASPGASFLWARYSLPGDKPSQGRYACTHGVRQVGSLPGFFMEVERSSRLELLRDPGFLANLGSLSNAELRALRSGCAEVEVVLSYVRRLAQARSDILASLMEQLADGVTAEEAAGGVREHLPEILGAQERPPGMGHMTELLAPDQEDPDYERLLDALDAIVDGDELGRLGDLAATGIENLEVIHSALVEFEAGVSSERRRLHEVIDNIQSEMVSRYRSGAALVDEILAERP